MKRKEIIKKFGKKVYNKLCKILEGTIITFDGKGDIEIPTEDVKRGLKIIKEKNKLLI